MYCNVTASYPPLTTDVCYSNVMTNLCLFSSLYCTSIVNRGVRGTNIIFSINVKFGIVSENGKKKTRAKETDVHTVAGPLFKFFFLSPRRHVHTFAGIFRTFKANAFFRNDIKFEKMKKKKKKKQ